MGSRRTRSEGRRVLEYSPGTLFIVAIPTSYTLRTQHGHDSGSAQASGGRHVVSPFHTSGDDATGNYRS